jgi:hypothetical protein
MWNIWYGYNFFLVFHILWRLPLLSWAAGFSAKPFWRKASFHEHTSATLHSRGHELPSITDIELRKSSKTRNKFLSTKLRRDIGCKYLLVQSWKHLWKVRNLVTQFTNSLGVHRQQSTTTVADCTTGNILNTRRGTLPVGVLVWACSFGALNKTGVAGWTG